MLITENDLISLSQGSEFLGSGGGGNSSILLPLTLRASSQYGPVNLIQVKDLRENDLIVPIAMIGSPSTSQKNKNELNFFLGLVEAIIKEFTQKNVVLMPAEIGGCNALAPFAVAARLKLRVLDADLIGRAFPKVSMCLPAILGGCLGKAYMNSRDNQLVSFSYSNVQGLEYWARQQAVEFGGSAVIATFLYAFSPEIKNKLIPGSVRLAMDLGKQPQQLIPKQNRIASGKVTALTTYTKHGFFFGKATVSTRTEEYHVYFQNEFLLCKNKDRAVIESPTLIILLNAKTWVPIASELLELGLEVEIISLRAHDFWYQETHHQQVSTEAFDFIDFI